MYYLLSACAFEDNIYGINKQYFGKVTDTHTAQGSQTSEDEKIAKYLQTYLFSLF